MRTILFLVFMIVFIVLLSNIAVMVDRSNGIPDVTEVLFPEKFADKEEQRAINSGVAPFESTAADAPAVNVPQQVYTAPGAQTSNAAPVNLDTAAMYDPLGGSIVVSQELDMPHRHEAAVNKWVTEAVADALTFSLSDYEQHLVDVDKYMAANGIAEYKKFLEESRVLGLMNGRNFDLKTFVTDIPKLAASGVTQDRYRWVYDIPLNMTFLPQGTSQYEGLQADQFVSETVTVRVQLGRVPTAQIIKEGDDTPSGILAREGIQLETWTALTKRVP